MGDARPGVGLAYTRSQAGLHKWCPYKKTGAGMGMTQMKWTEELARMGEQALLASRELARTGTDAKNRALAAMADEVSTRERDILQANAEDVSAAEKTGARGAFIDRLRLDTTRVSAIADGLRQVAALPDPVGGVIREWERPNGLEIAKVRVPIGVIAIVYESRPNVTADAAGLCLKSGNSCILRGGSEAIRSNSVIADALSRAAEKTGLPASSVQLVRRTERELVGQLVRMSGTVDVVIPRGGEGLIRAVTEQATVPVMKHYKGVCHTYVDKAADLAMAEEICFNAKVQRPGVCNAMETMLVHREVAGEFLPRVAKGLIEAGVELRGCRETCSVLKEARPALEEDWSEEYLDLVLAVRVVGSLEEAAAHINRYGSAHSDAIVTGDDSRAERFLQAVDAACVYVNASTRFTDGGEFGMGAEIGISTDKLHARGPVGLEELTTYKYIIRGSGQVRT